MEQSESIKELAGALAKAQAELKPAEMNATNPFLKNKYADLGEVIKASRQALASHGLSVAQPVSCTETTVNVTTQLMHESGEWIRDTMVFPLGETKGKSLAQEAGSIITYLRRYSLSSMLGIYADDDTDGESKPAQNANRASQNTNSRPPQVTQPPAPVAVVTVEAAKDTVIPAGSKAGKKLHEVPPADVDRMVTWYTNNAKTDDDHAFLAACKVLQDHYKAQQPA